MVIAECSFCSKSSTEVERLVAGPGVYICNECVALCQQLMQEVPKQEDTISRVSPWDLVKTPEEVLAHLPRVATAATKVDANLAGWVSRARQLGASWAAIGQALGMTRQSAWERFAAET